MDSWQPIETAPRDGTALLLYDEGIGTRRRFAAQGTDCAVGSWGSTLDSGPGWLSDLGEPVEPYGSPEIDYTFLYPSHWMPLPAPPTED